MPLVLAFGTGVSPCDDDVPIGGEDGCLYDGDHYDFGDRFPSADGCNTCECGDDGQVACTLLGCEPIACTYEGRGYRAGETFAAGDGCNTCECRPDGTVTCTEIACEVCADGRPVCVGGEPSCDRGGECCHPRSCDEPALCTSCLPEPVCTYDGERYRAGDRFPSTDGCNECTCLEDGEVGCTRRACASPPECIVTGCSGQICADDHVVTTCEWTDAYACYDTARCARQADGECGWTETEDLRRCLAAGGPTE